MGDQRADCNGHWVVYELGLQQQHHLWAWAWAARMWAWLRCVPSLPKAALHKFSRPMRHAACAVANAPRRQHAFQGADVVSYLFHNLHHASMSAEQHVRSAVSKGRNDAIPLPTWLSPPFTRRSRLRRDCLHPRYIPRLLNIAFIVTTVSARRSISLIASHRLPFEVVSRSFPRKSAPHLPSSRRHHMSDRSCLSKAPQHGF